MPASSHVTTPKDIQQAAAALDGVAVRTNLERSERLSSEAGVDILLKREDQQKCRSFKVRGAYARMSLLSPAERERGVVCASAGNHAQGLEQFICPRIHPARSAAASRRSVGRGSSR